jgi:LPS export ABC transporter protein LptC
VRFEGFDRGARDVALVARRAQIDPETRVAHLEDVEIDLSARIGRGPLRVTAPAGELDLRTDRFRLTGGVEGSTRPGEAFTTDSVSYDESSGELFSDSRVELRRSNLYLTAARMRLDVEAGRVRLLGGVRARMQAR